MTREEAIQILKRELEPEDGKWHPFEEVEEALDMAIEALKMQNNCIICPRCGREFSEYEGREQTNDK